MAKIGYCKCNKVKDFEMDELPWIIRVGPKCNHKGLCRRKVEGNHRQKRTRQCDHGCSDVASTRGRPQAPEAAQEEAF